MQGEIKQGAPHWAEQPAELAAISGIQCGKALIFEHWFHNIITESVSATMADFNFSVVFPVKSDVK